MLGNLSSKLVKILSLPRLLNQKKTLILLLILSVPFFYFTVSIKFDHMYIVKKRDILMHLHPATVGDQNSSANFCDYANVIENHEHDKEYSLPQHLMNEIRNVTRGGSYTPSDCQPLYSTALIVPYRDRIAQLKEFTRYMHLFLKVQKIHYKIYVIEQKNSGPFNRAKLLNVGAVYALNDGFPCLIFHDIDLLPMKLNNIYACTVDPRHLSVSIDKFRFVLPYQTIFGGAVAIRSDQFQQVNGMSNEYIGWGGEDDDFYSRILSQNLKTCRFEPEISQYHMLKHAPQGQAFKGRYTRLQLAVNRIKLDGLKTLHFKEVGKFIEPLYTHILVDI